MEFLGRLVEVSVDPFGIDGVVSDSISDSWGAGEGVEEKGEGEGEVPGGNEKVPGIRGANLFCTSIPGESLKRGALTPVGDVLDFVISLLWLEEVLDDCLVSERAPLTAPE